MLVSLEFYVDIWEQSNKCNVINCAGCNKTSFSVAKYIRNGLGIFNKKRCIEGNG